VAIGKKGRLNRVTEKLGVREVQAIFENGGSLFQPVDLAHDVGKDAYVDLAEDGVFTGRMIAVQVKSGKSYRDGDDYKVPCDADDIAVWRGSTVPIYGMVYDPEAGTVHWQNLTAWSTALEAGDVPSFCPVSRNNLLSGQTLRFFVEHVESQERRASPRVLDLMSSDPVKQMAAVGDCLAFGRSDPRPLQLLRTSVRWLQDPDALWPAIQILALATPHQISIGQKTTGCLQR
jgi:hypothetical protein